MKTQLKIFYDMLVTMFFNLITDKYLYLCSLMKIIKKRLRIALEIVA